MAFPPSTPLDFVEEDYIGFYNRAGDAPGANFWVNQLASNSKLGVAVGFAVSSETLAIYPYLSAPNVVSPTTYIDQIYSNVFGRVADSAGESFWVNRLAQLNSFFSNANGTVNQANLQAFAPGTDLTRYNNALTQDPKFIAATEVLTEMLQSVNMQTGTADANLMANRITVAEDYTTRTGNSNTPFSQGSAHAVIAATTSDSASVPVAEAVTTAYIAGTNNQPITFNATVGVDTFDGTNQVANDIVNAVPAGTTGTSPTLTALDSFTGGSGNNTINVVDVTAGFVIPTNVTVKNFQNVNISAAGTLNGDISTWTGALKAVVSEAGGSAGGSFKAAGTTAVTLTDTAAAASTISVQGGSAVTVTANGVTAGGTINVGTVTAPTGAVTVTANELATQATSVTADAINVKGGTTVTVTANLSAAENTAGTAVTGGAIGVTGTAATTSVTVNQSAAAAGSAAVAAVTGVVGVAPVTAAPGVNGVTAVAAATPSAAKAAVSGVVDGAVTIADANTNAATNTIASVTLANYGAGSSITSNALNTLSLSGTAGTLALTRTAANSSNTLALTLNGLSAPTITFGVVTSATGGTNTISDANNEITTLNVTTAGKDSVLSGFTDTALTTLNIAGSNVLSLGAVNTSLTSIAVSGAAGFSGDISAVGGTLALTTTSSGKITATLDSTTQTFTGSTGQDVITITADALKAITGGSGTTDEIILNANATTFTAAKTGAKVTGFETIGVTTASQGTYDISQFGGSAIKTLDVIGTTAAAVNFTKVTAGTALTIDASDTMAIGYQVSDANGAADSVSVTLGTATTKTAITAASLTLQDANNVGIGTLNLVSNNSGFNTANVITALADNGLSTLNVSGTGGLTITALNETATQATSFTINNTETNAAGVTIGTFTDANLGALTFTGSNASSIGTLAGITGKVLTISNTGTSTASIGEFNADTALQTLTLNGNVALNANGAADGQLQGDTVAGLTVNGGTDNAHVNLTLAGVGAGATDTITLGNGNDLITDGSTAGKVVVNVGTGYNLIDVHAGTASTYGATVTLGAHTDTTTLWDQVNVSVVNGQASGFSTSISGVVAGDHVVFTDTAAATTVLTLSAAQQNTITAQANLAGAITAAFADSTAAHQAIAFQYGGDTYVIDNVGLDTTLTAGTDTVVKLVGVHTIAANATLGHIVVAS